MKAQCCFLDSCVAFTSCKDSIANYSCVTIFSRVQGRWFETGRSSLLAGIGSFDVADSRFWFELVSSILAASMMACIVRCICSRICVRFCWFGIVDSSLFGRFCGVELVDSVQWNGRTIGRAHVRGQTDGLAGGHADEITTHEQATQRMDWRTSKAKPIWGSELGVTHHITSHHITLHSK